MRLAASSLVVAVLGCVTVATAAAREVLVGRDLADLPIIQIPSIPVDGRHNSKIDRPGLRADIRATR